MSSKEHKSSEARLTSPACEKVLKNPLSMFGQYAFWMKLDTGNRKILMFDTHDLAIPGERRNI
jgi:hypothetical protein